MTQEPQSSGLTASQRRRLYAQVIRRRKRKRRLLGVTAGLGVLAAAVAVYFAVGHSTGGDKSPATSSLPPPPRAAATSTGTTPRTTASTKKTKPGLSQLLTASDRASFQTLERALGGTSGLAVSWVGLSRPMVQLGTLQQGVAWSTIKVPIALAVEARFEGFPPSSTQALLARAITASDNAAAEELWGSLGTPHAAAGAVQRVLAATGDASTRVETRVLRPGFTSFGQTNWPLAAQQRFIAGLMCVANARSVLTLMQEIEPDQRWGLGTLGRSARFKGGWGPDPSGRYLVRQMGVVRLANGRLLAASIATMPADGSFTRGTAHLSQIARWLSSHVAPDAVPAANC